MMIPSWIEDDAPIADPMGHGERAVAWLRRLKHPKNPARGRPFQLHPWQERIVRAIYGPRHPDGSRIVRRVTMLLPRGNRKTSLCAGLTLLHLTGPERTPGGLIVSAASAHEQARELFLETALIVEGDRRRLSHLNVRDYTSAISFKDERSRYVAVASDGNTGGRRGEPRGIVHGQEAVIPLPSGGSVPVEMRGGGGQEGGGKVAIELNLGKDLEARILKQAGSHAMQINQAGMKQMRKEVPGIMTKSQLRNG